MIYLVVYGNVYEGESVEDNFTKAFSSLESAEKYVNDYTAHSKIWKQILPSVWRYNQDYIQIYEIEVSE